MPDVESLPLDHSLRLKTQVFMRPPANHKTLRTVIDTVKTSGLERHAMTRPDGEGFNIEDAPRTLAHVHV